MFLDSTHVLLLSLTAFSKGLSKNDLPDVRNKKKNKNHRQFHKSIFDLSVIY